MDSVLRSSNLEGVGIMQLLSSTPGLGGLFRKLLCKGVPSLDWRESFAAPSYLAIILKHNNELLFFDKVEHDDQGRETHSHLPVFIPMDDLDTIETDLLDIRKHFLREYMVDVGEIHLSLNCMCMRPFKDLSLHMAVVEIDDESYHILKDQFRVIPTAKVLLRRDTNLFYDLVAREFEAKLFN